MPPNSFSVTRPGMWGNPFATAAEFKQVYRMIEREAAMNEFTCDHKQYEHMRTIYMNVKLLRGRNLACFCPIGHDCHADFLIEVANEEKNQ